MNIKFERKKILVVGDFMIDAYWKGDVSRISPEAPIPVFRKESSRWVVGGAANVAANLIGAGQFVYAASVVGNDINGKDLIERLDTLGCDTRAVVTSTNRNTTVKTRILANNNQQVLRIDEENKTWLNSDELNLFKEAIKNVIPECDAVILSDYMKGVLSEEICQFTILRAKEYEVPVFVDVKDANVGKYSGAFLLKPNRKELHDLTMLPVDTKDQIVAACDSLSRLSSCDNILVTLGGDGMLLYENGLTSIIQCKAKEVFDVSGAGDTAISYLVSAYANKCSLLDSSNIANVASGIKVSKVGTATVSAEEVEEWFNNASSSHEKKAISKIVAKDELMRILHNNHNKKVVFTNGCFDILHAGHVTYLYKASQFGDILVVGVNSDESVRRLKGPSRPINNENDRMVVLSSLGCVSYVVLFEEDTPLNLIETICPNVLVKGADYKEEDVVGADFVKKNGGEVKLIPLLEGRSTTNIVNQIEKNK